MKRFFGVLLFFVFASADAALVSRLGGQAVYDTDLDITWLADANAGAGSTFDIGVSSTDGLMTQTQAGAWAASLTVGGFTDWRLPTTTQPDSSCDSQSGGSPPTGAADLNCTGSELGHLFYLELGGTAGSSILTSGDPDLALFTNILMSRYWSSALFASIPGSAWEFSMSNGEQLVELTSDERAVWAVRSGDVAAVPVPAAVWLFGSALGLLGWMRRKTA